MSLNQKKKSLQAACMNVCRILRAGQTEIKYRMSTEGNHRNKQLNYETNRTKCCVTKKKIKSTDYILCVSDAWYCHEGSHTVDIQNAEMLSLLHVSLKCFMLACLQVLKQLFVFPSHRPLPDTTCDFYTRGPQTGP